MTRPKRGHVVRGPVKNRWDAASWFAELRVSTLVLGESGAVRVMKVSNTMTSRLVSSAFRLVSLILAFLLGIGAFAAVRDLGWLSPFGIGSESHDSQVINAVERTQEVSLLSLGIQGITDEDKCAEAFGRCVPGSTEKVFLQYNFQAKLGIDGAEVTVTKTGKHAYLLSIPEFSFIGYDEPTFKVAAEDGGVLDWITPDIDQVEMINKILNDDKQTEYVASYEGDLEDQTRVFYDGLITSIDPDAVTTFEFQG